MSRKLVLKTSHDTEEWRSHRHLLIPVSRTCTLVESWPDKRRTLKSDEMRTGLQRARRGYCSKGIGYRIALRPELTNETRIKS